MKYAWRVELPCGGCHILRDDQWDLAMSYAELGYEVVDLKENV